MYSCKKIEIFQINKSKEWVNHFQLEWDQKDVSLSLCLLL